MTLSLLSATRRKLCAALVLLACAAGSVLAAADAARKSFDLPAAIAEQALKRLAEQSGREVLFPADAVEGVRTRAVKGEMTPREALDAMLAGTPLTGVQDARTGALTVRRTSPAAAPKNAESPVVDSASITGPIVKLEGVEVTGSRLRLNTGERPVQPVLTYTSQDIERLGAANLGQLFQYIPSVTSSTTGLGTELVTGGTAGGFVGQITARATANLRGGTETSTLLLVDGKRVPITARKNAGGNAYDLGGIPLSAIERVEVLLDGASAIYGADAIYGVINVILKKRYSGTELKLNYDNTFDGDAGIKTASLTHGFSTGKLSGLITLSASNNNIMLLTDRRLTSTYNRTLLGGTSDGSSPTVFIQGSGTVNVASGSLPGITPATPRASVPTGMAGTMATIADFASAPAPIAGFVPNRQGAMSYVRQENAYARFTYDFSDRLRLTATARLGSNHTEDNGQYRYMQNVTIPAGYPGNPFGVPVRLTKYFYDLPPIYQGVFVRNDDYNLMASGKLTDRWRYEASVTYSRGVNKTQVEYSANGVQIDYTMPASTVAAAINAAVAAGRRPPLIYDSRTVAPNAATALDEFFLNTTGSVQSDLNENRIYTAQVDGELFTLPAGAVQLVVGSELRQESVAFPGSVGGAIWPSIPQRDVTSFFAETRVPLAAPKQHLPLLHQLDLSVAGRYERYSGVGKSTTPRYGTAWRPFKAMLVRGSWGEGFLVPPLYRTASAQTYSTVAWSALASTGADPLRGNTVSPGSVTVTGGGNPNLRPQRSEHTTYGVIVDVPKVAGLSVSLDWFDNKYTDNIGSIGTIADRVAYVPETITRGPNLPTDLPGWAGPIIAYDLRSINISMAHTSGYNYGVRYQRSTRWGDFSVSSTGEKILRDEQRVLPSLPLTTTINKRNRPMRVTSAFSWARKGLEFGATAVYGGEYWVETSNVAVAASRFTDSVVRWDFNVGYDFGPSFASADASWWRRALKDTKWRVTVINAFNTEPPLDVRGFFSSSVIDPRLRRYVIDFTKRF